jgi:predicted aldo/keto reductase-like oxidoreductase
MVRNVFAPKEIFKAMERRILGKTDLEVSVVGFGGIPIQGLSATAAEKVLLSAQECGINFIDTARGYTDSETKIGRFLTGRRNDWVLASKAMSRDAIGMQAELEASLKDLVTDWIDLYQLHGVGTDEQLAQVLAPDGAYQALDKARQAGQLRYIGVTGHSRETLLKAIKSGMFDTVQHPFNPIETEWADEIIPAAQRAGMGIIGMKPLAGGALQQAPAALKYSLTHGMDVVIPGMDSVEQVRDNATAGLNLQPPSPEEMTAIKEEKKTWTGQFCHRCGYCLPCANDLNIPFLLLLQAYYERYGLKGWAQERLGGLEKKYSDCLACNECLSRCPYDLPIPDMMRKAREQLA